MKKTIQLVAIMLFAICCTYCTKPATENKNMITGQVLDTPYGNPIANIKISAMMVQSRGMGFFGPLMKGSAVTDKDGQFTIAATITPDLFNNNHLEVEADPGQQYLSVYPGYIPDHYAKDWQQDYKDIRFKLYQKSNLSIQLKNIQHDRLIAFVLSYRYDVTGVGKLNYYSTTPLADTLINVETAVGVKTYINWTKYYAPGQFVDYSDSIICAPGNNQYVLNF